MNSEENLKLLEELADRVGLLETRVAWGERVIGQVLRLLQQLTKPRREQTA